MLGDTHTTIAGHLWPWTGRQGHRLTELTRRLRRDLLRCVRAGQRISGSDYIDVSLKWAWHWRSWTQRISALRIFSTLLSTLSTILFCSVFRSRRTPRCWSDRRSCLLWLFLPLISALWCSLCVWFRKHSVRLWAIQEVTRHDNTIMSNLANLEVHFLMGLGLMDAGQSLKESWDSSDSQASWNVRFNASTYGYGSIPIHTIFRGMNIHLPAIMMFTRGTIGFDHPHILHYLAKQVAKKDRAETHSKKSSDALRRLLSGQEAATLQQRMTCLLIEWGIMTDVLCGSFGGREIGFWKMWNAEKNLLAV